MGKYIFVLLALLAAVIAGCGVSPRPLDEPVYVMEEHSLAIELPGDGWRVEEFRDEGAFSFDKEGRPGRYLVMMSPLEDRNRLGRDILSRELFVEFRNKRFYGPPLRAEISGEEAICQDVGAALDGRDVMIRSCTLVRGGKVYDFVCWSLGDDFNDALRLFSSVIAGARFIDDEVE